ncbi:phage structural protein [Clostridium rectalis]|uniref:phage structural protein n=1 Tax=Clostridium rectalis TaxID=2040295 RepID=UPI000F6416B6|nr:phage protein [Clostridium rectalis]
MTTTYDFNLVNLIISYSAGTHYVRGFSNGSQITTARNTDKYIAHSGAKGDTSFAKTNDNSGTIVFTLKHDSPSNKVLSLLAKSDEEFSVQMVDGNDSSRAKTGGNRCVIMKPADMIRGAEISEREWTIAVPNLEIADE